MASFAAVVASVLLSPQAPPPGPPPGAPQGPVPAVVLEPPAELVVVRAADPIPIAAFGLGAGGIDEARRGELQVAAGQCTTPGGVQVLCRREGVLLRFPGKADLLFAPDGFLHLRERPPAGPFPAGAELRLGDGAMLRIERGGSRRSPLTAVVVEVDGQARCLWRHGQVVDETVRPSAWGGPRLLVAGTGDAVYRAIALGPIVALDRVLCSADQERRLPAQRAALLATPLLQSLAALPRELRRPDPDVERLTRQAVAVAEAGARVFADERDPARVDARRARFALGGGYEVQFDFDTPGPLRLTLHAGDSREGIVEWTFAYVGEVHLPNPHASEAGQPRWLRNSLRLPTIAADLQARPELLELEEARRVLRRLQR